MEKKEKQLEVFREKAADIAREWIEAAVRGEETHPKYTDQIYMIECLARDVMTAEDDEPAL